MAMMHRRTMDIKSQSILKTWEGKMIEADTGAGIMRPGTNLFQRRGGI